MEALQQTRLEVPLGKNELRISHMFVLAVVARILFSLYVDDTLAVSDNPAYVPTSITPANNIRSVEMSTLSAEPVAFSMNRQASVCNATIFRRDDDDKNTVWSKLCETSFLASADNKLKQGLLIHIVQIGAHTGFEHNDPFAQGLTTYLDLLSPTERESIIWTFVEPSPPNFKRLQENVNNHTDVCQMRALNAAVVSDSLPDKDIEALAFYSISDSIDPETGHDSKSNHTFPFWVSQISSFTKSPILWNKRIWKKKGLDVNDYIVETNVTALRYSDLMRKHIDKNHAPHFVLIDTEGFDCKIILGISPTSDYLPPYLVYEHKQCGPDGEIAVKHLEGMNYTVTQLNGENTFAYKGIV